MKLTKPMIILGQIQQVDPQILKDKQDPNKVTKMFLLVISDKTKPSVFRCMTQLCMFLTEEKFRGIFGPGNPQDAEDRNVTLAVKELSPYNAYLKVKGQLLLDHLDADHLRMLQNAGSSEEQTGSTVGKPSASPTPSKPPAKS